MLGGASAANSTYGSSAYSWITNTSAYQWLNQNVSTLPLSIFSAAASVPVGTAFGVKFEIPSVADNDVRALFTGTQWAGNTITYSLPDSRSDYELINPSASGFRALSMATQEAFHHIFNGSGMNGGQGMKLTSLASFTTANWVYAGHNDANIQLGGRQPGEIINRSHGFYPGTPIYGGDTWIEAQYDAPNLSSAQAEYKSYLLLHELGHALGLKHTHDSAGNLPKMSAEHDNTEYTVMTYNVRGAHPQTYMMYDILALQYMYGADFGSNSGNTVYTWNPQTGETYVNGASQGKPATNKIFLTIWDGGGNDTYDFSNYTGNAVVDLSPGGYSLFSGTQKAQNVKGNVYNALQYKGDDRSLIENASTGNGNDQIAGNKAANVLRGNGGNDTISGAAGHDYLYGGAGNDVIDGGADDDTVQGNEGDDLIRGGLGQDWLFGMEGNDTIYGGDGNDYIYGGTGADFLYGDGGNDILVTDTGGARMTGGSGVDTFRFTATAKSNVITDFVAGWGVADRIELSSSLFSSFAAVKTAAFQNGYNLIIAKDGFSLTLNNVLLTRLVADDFAFI